MVPDYLRELCRSVSEDDARSSLRSAEHGDLIVPRAATKFGDKAFAISGPLMWNSLTTTVRNSSILSNFKSALKSILFTWLFSRLHQQLRSVKAPLNRFYVLWRHRNYRLIIIIIIIWHLQQCSDVCTIWMRVCLAHVHNKNVEDWNFAWQLGPTYKPVGFEHPSSRIPMRVSWKGTDFQPSADAYHLTSSK